MGAVYVRGGITGGEILRVVSVGKETEAAGGVERVRPRVGKLVVESVPGLLGYCDEQRIVVRPAEGRPQHRVGAVSDVRRTQIGIATGVGVVGFREQLVSLGICRLVTVAVNLPIDGA